MLQYVVPYVLLKECTRTDIVGYKYEQQRTGSWQELYQYRPNNYVERPNLCILDHRKWKLPSKLV